MQSQFIDIHASADYLAPGAIEVNRYQTEILDRVRRRLALGQRIDQTPATGQPSRWFEQVSIPTGTFVDPRRLGSTPGQSQRQERVVSLKALMGGINFGLFDVEVNQQQAQFSYLEAKDLTDAVDGVLKTHDIALWTGNDTSLLQPTSVQYYGISGQLFNAPTIGFIPPTFNVGAQASLIDAIKHQSSLMASRTDFEVRPSAVYANPLFLDMVDKEAKQFQLYFNKVQVLPGVIVQGIPTQLGIMPLIPDPGITPLNQAGQNYAIGGLAQYSFFILSEDLVQFHWLTSPLPRVFQLGLTANLAAQYSVVKFGAVVVKGASYAHGAGYTIR